MGAGSANPNGVQNVQKFVQSINSNFAKIFITPGKTKIHIKNTVKLCIYVSIAQLVNIEGKT